MGLRDYSLAAWTAGTPANKSRDGVTEEEPQPLASHEHCMHPPLGAMAPLATIHALSMSFTVSP